MRKWFLHIVSIALCLFFLVAGTGVNIHCHCNHHCHSHYVQLCDEGTVVVEQVIPAKAVHNLLYAQQPLAETIPVMSALLYRGEHVHDGRVPIPVPILQFRQLLCMWLI